MIEDQTYFRLKIYIERRNSGQLLILRIRQQTFKKLKNSLVTLGKIFGNDTVEDVIENS